jgi:hypothetical protein
MGQQELVPMVQLAPPPVSQPNTPPQPAGTYVWMMMQKSTAGGIVIYWISPEYTDGRRLFQSHHYPNFTLDPAWDGSFVYVRRFGDHSFLVSHPLSISIAPPDSIHGEKDLEMLAVFEQNFATMNQEVRDNLDAVRFIPPTAPPADPNGRKFFRVWADWGEDSDGDSVPDWEEFAMMNGIAGVGADGTLLGGGTTDGIANPANPDANGNGVPDVEELDFDQDTIPRSEDADPRDGVIAWRKTRPTRHALFDVPLRNYSNGYPILPIGVNSQGMVLFEDGVEYGGAFHPLPHDGITWGRTHAINESGSIVGYATFPHGEDQLNALAVWPSPTAASSLVGDDDFIGSPTYEMAYGGLSFGSAFGSDGSFVAETFELIEDENGNHYEYRYPEVWKRHPNGSFTHGQSNTLSRFCKAGEIHWGWDQAGHQILTAPLGGGDLGMTGFDKYNLVGGGEPALTGGFAPSLFHVKGAWKASPTLGNALDISDTGIARVEKAPVKENIPEGLAFWMNGRFLHLNTLVPDLPQIYQNWPRVTVPGMADKGTFVLQMDSGHPLDPSACALCLPCSVEDTISESLLTAFRDGEQDTVPFTGVDDVSITADKPDPSAANKIWIMAPIGSKASPNTVKLHVPATATNPLTLNADNLEGNHTVDQDNGEALSIKGTGNATSDAGLTLNTGPLAASNAPIGIKSMKRRNVRVTVTPVGLSTIYNGQPIVRYPEHLPTKEKLEKYLKKVYELQVNAEIVLTYANPIALAFSLMTVEDLHLDPNKPLDDTTQFNIPVLGGGALDVLGGNDRSKEENAFIPLRDPDADINVYYVGGISTIRGWIKKDTSPEGYHTWRVLGANGYADVVRREAWVSDFRLDNPPVGMGEQEQRQYEILQKNTIAHEIGHVIVGEGHPNQSAGPAPLPGTAHLDRLMLSGGVSSNQWAPGTRLVKGEWDAAEVWLQGCPYPPIQSTPPNP